ncbi:MAG: MGMT family protein [Theionarchaea archaeon]|nr:MGMT family protein [Theionarchaea archaeon]
MKVGQAALSEGTCLVIMDEKIYEILFPGQTPEDATLERDEKADRIAEKVVQWIESGEVFSYPFHVQGTPFQQKVYKATQRIPKGKVATYGAVAKSVDTRAYRAVGRALGRNPVPLLVPCHRVIGSDRELTGFGGGIPLKKKILEAEGVEFEGEKVKKEYILETL